MLLLNLLAKVFRLTQHGQVIPIVVAYSDTLGCLKVQCIPKPTMVHIGSANTEIPFTVTYGDLLSMGR